MVVAEMLGKTLGEVHQMPLEEFHLWLEWRKIQSDETKRATGGKPPGRR